MNLYSDRRIGLIDRHNYFASARTSMLSSPGASMLSEGMRQVADRPFMISEWSQDAPYEFVGEGPAIFGAYGLGLNGWDVSFMFQNGDLGRFGPKLVECWDTLAPQMFGLFPAIARQIIRHDIRESETVFALNVDYESLKKGQLNFEDQYEHRDGLWSFSTNTTPIQALAVGRVVVDFVDEPKKTETVDVSKYMKDGAYVSTTGELAWRPGEHSRDGHITINTPRTQASVGFAGGKTVDLKDVTITTENHFAYIYVTSLDDNPITTSKSILVTTIARARNTNMKQHGGTLIRLGEAPILMEPVVVDLSFKRGGTPTVHVLDHDGCRTGKTLPVVAGKIKLDARETMTVYYEIEY
jgi:hypothetical protein